MAVSDHTRQVLASHLKSHKLAAEFIACVEESLTAPSQALRRAVYILITGPPNPAAWSTILETGEAIDSFRAFQLGRRIGWVAAAEIVAEFALGDY